MDVGQDDKVHRDASSLKLRYRELAQAVAEFTSRHGEQRLIDAIHSRTLTSIAEATDVEAGR